jgi:hypothetical protein
MKDKDFYELWQSLTILHGLGVYTVIFNKDKEDYIRKGIEDKYGEILTKETYLCNVQLVFI